MFIPQYTGTILCTGKFPPVVCGGEVIFNLNQVRLKLSEGSESAYNKCGGQTFQTRKKRFSSIIKQGLTVHMSKAIHLRDGNNKWGQTF